MKIIWGDNFFSQNIAPGRYTTWVEKKHLLPNYKKIKESEIFEFPKRNKDQIIEQVKNDLIEQGERKKGLEDKIKAILFTISVSITAITFSLTYEKTSFSSFLDITSLIILGLSIFYFVSSAILSVKTLIPIDFYNNQSDILFDKEEKKITITIPKPDEELKQLLKHKLLNDNINLRIANATYSVLKLLRNGMVLFAVYFLIALYQKVFSQPIQKTKVYNGKIYLKLNDSQNVILPYNYENTQRVNLKLQQGEIIKKKK
jgi:hypothetical protein